MSNVLLMRKIIFFSTIGIFVFLGFLYPQGINSKAQSGITISPSSYELHLQPGETEIISAFVENNSNTKTRVRIFFENINLEALSKEDRLWIEDQKHHEAPAIWLSTKQREFTVNPNEDKKVTIEVKIPKNTETKGYYPAIVFHLEELESAGERVELTDRIISLILLDVAEVKGVSTVSSARINSFSVNKRIVFSPSVKFDISFENTGETFLQPRGKVTVYDRSGKRLAEGPTINDAFSYLLQGQKLNETVEWKDTFSIIPSFGKYTAVAEIYHNPDQKEVSRAETTFYVIPLFHILILGGTILFVIVILLILRYKRRGFVLRNPY